MDNLKKQAIAYNLKDQVESILKLESHTRNSDVFLTIRVWQTFYNVRQMIFVAQLYDLPREDNIKRIRAKFCEEGNVWAYPTDIKIARQRGILEDKWRQALGYPILSEVNYPSKEISYTEKLVAESEHPAVRENAKLL